ncbi:nitrilase family protein [soil metagenome]
MQTLTLTLIQTDVFWENKEQNFLMLTDKIRNIKEKTEVIILPEMFSTGFSMNAEMLAEDMNGPTVHWMKKMAAEKKAILTGSIIIREQDKFYNRLIWMLPTGDYGVYDKRHLFAFGEEDQHYTAGNKRLIASVKGWKINLQICYDLRFPVWSRQSPDAEKINEPEFDILIFVANWPEKRSHAWKTLLQARAIENQSYTIGVNRVGNDGKNIYYNGNSMITDPLGEVLYTKAIGEEVFTYTISKEKLEEVRSKFPFGKDADKFRLL